MRTNAVIFLFFGLICCMGCKEDTAPTPLQTEKLKYSLDDFQSAQACSTCHPQYFREWNGSMHHYASNDPIWNLASNSVQSSSHGALQSWCWQCHAPIAWLTGNTSSPFQISDLPPIVREGINCDICHKMRPPYNTTLQTVTYNYEAGRMQYGTLTDPVPTHFHDSEKDETLSRSESCRTCHDLVINGVPTEMTFTEWQNSPYGAMSKECQDCHMTTYKGQAAVGGPVRENLHRHDFIGVDIAVTDFPDTTSKRAAIDSLLKNSVTFAISVPPSANRNDSIRISAQVFNDKTGHNIPTSVFFFRQMWIEVTVTNGNDTAYTSGHRDEAGDIISKDLVIFGGDLFKNGEPANVFELDSLVNNSIPPFESRTAQYTFSVNTSGAWSVNMRLLFRPFGPSLYRSLSADKYIPKIPLFEIASVTKTISVL